MNSNSSYSPETLNSGQNWQFLYRVTLKLDGWPWKIMSHLFYTMLSYVHSSKAMGEFKLELQSRNIQFGSKGQLFVPCDLESWWMTLENHRAPHLCGFKLCASFHSHQWIPIVITARKRPILVKIGDFFCTVWPSNLTDDPPKTIGHIFYATLRFVYYFVAIGDFKLQLQSGNAQFGSILRIF